MEIIIDLRNLSEVLLLHFASSLTFATVLGRVREEHLVDDDVVDVNLLLGQFDGESLCLVHAQELRDAHCDKSSLSFIFKLLVHLFDLSLHSVDSIEQLLLDVVSVGSFLLHHGLHLGESSSKFVFEFDQFQ